MIQKMVYYLFKKIRFHHDLCKKTTAVTTENSHIYMWVACEWAMLEQFWNENTTQEQLEIFAKILKYNKFLCTISCTKNNVPLIRLYILLTSQMNKSCSESIGVFWSGGIDTVWCRKSQTKNQQYSERFLKLNQ